ncbi:MAG: hypothetical protein ACRCWO_04760 [Bosea sp. (in: a-proteobacteria)]
MGIGIGFKYIGRSGVMPYRSHGSDALSADDLEIRIATLLRPWVEQQGILAADDYRDLMGFLADNDKRFEVVEAGRFLGYQNPEKVAVFLRHDIDLDLCGAVVMSGIEQQHGFRSSYFILHNECAYYGRFLPDTVFERYTIADAYIARLQALGQDVGLHIDPLGITGWAAVNGIAAMVYEIERLRGLGIRMSSVCSHNSSSVYNAMNQDVFAGANRTGQTHVMCKGYRFGLGDIDPARIGIDHLCDFLVTDRLQAVPATVSAYGYVIDCQPSFRLLYDTSFSLMIGQRWEVGGRSDYLDDRLQFDNADMGDALLRVPRGSKIVLNIHPMYYGARAGVTPGL